LGGSGQPRENTMRHAAMHVAVLLAAFGISTSMFAATLV
jgi:hypothetical protein